MVSVSNLDDIPAIDLYPPSEAPGYYRSESPDILKVSSVVPSDQPPDEKSMKSVHGVPYDAPFFLPPTPEQAPPSTADSGYQPGYYLQRVRKKPLEVSQNFIVFTQGPHPPLTLPHPLQLTVVISQATTS